MTLKLHFKLKSLAQLDVNLRNIRPNSTSSWNQLTKAGDACPRQTTALSCSGVLHCTKLRALHTGLSEIDLCVVFGQV